MSQFTISQPGVYDGIPSEVYQADPVSGGSLSRSGARRLLPPSCPALYRQWALDGERAKREFDLGHATHLKILGAGPPVVVIQADNYLTKAAKQQRDEARAAGETPILAAEADQINAMANALWQHPYAKALFSDGRPEQVLVWQHDSIWLRARLDWLPEPSSRTGRLIIPDYKSTVCAEPEFLRRAMHQHRYNDQAAWYLDGIRQLRLVSDVAPAFVFVFQEKTPPFLVTIAEPDAPSLRWGHTRNLKAIDVYRQCRETNRWPGYADDVIPLGLPRWAEYELEAADERGEFELEQP